jgi:virulence factor Mce-like protein
MRNRSGASVVASPVLVGAVTVLIVVVGVLLAVQANNGLPFVPTYNVSAELPGGSNLTPNAEVVVGGFRVGQVTKIRSRVAPEYPGRAIAVIDMKLDKSIEPLPVNTKVLIRPRSPLGLKFVELIPGPGEENLKAGDALPLRNATKPIELDEFFSLNDEEFRTNQRKVFKGYGNALAGRGEHINRAIEDLVPFFTHLTPVMRTLSDPETRLAEFFRQSRGFSAQIAPVATTYADLFENMATTFEALSRRPERLQQAIERGAPTLETGIRSLPVQRVFLRDSEKLFTELEPVAQQFEKSLPVVADALETGTPVLRKAPTLYENTQNVLAALRDLARNPVTLIALKDLTTTVKVLEPLVTYVAPYQTVCNYWNYYWTAIGEHVSEPVRGGTIQRSVGKTDFRGQDNRVGDSTADRYVDVRTSQDPQAPVNGQTLQALHSGSYEPAVDAQGNADCQVGQRGYLDGPVASGNRYAPSDDPQVGSAMDNAGGGSHVVIESDLPGLFGPTFKGVPSLKDLP